MYCIEGSQSTHFREWVQHYVAGTSPGTALQGDSSGFSGQLLSSTLALESSALQAVLKWPGWLFRAGRKGVLFWHPQPCGRHQQWGEPTAPLALSRPPWATDSKLWFVTSASAAEWLVDRSWHYFFLILYLLFSEYFGWVIIQCVLCIAEPRNICFGFSSWLVRVCGFWPRSHGIVSDYVNEIFIQENNEYRPENKAHPVAISQRQFFLLKPIRGSAVVIIYTCP